MAELHVQWLSCRICCHQHISFIAEMNQSVVAFFHRHGAIDLLTFQALIFQYTNQEILCLSELSKYQDFIVSSYTTAAQGVYFLHQCSSLSIRFSCSALLCFFNELLQHLYFRVQLWRSMFHRIVTHIQFIIFIVQWTIQAIPIKIIFILPVFQSVETSAKRRKNCIRTATCQLLKHHHHQTCSVAFRRFSPAKADTDIVCDMLVECYLCRMTYGVKLNVKANGGTLIE